MKLNVAWLKAHKPAVAAAGVAGVAGIAYLSRHKGSSSSSAPAYTDVTDPYGNGGTVPGYVDPAAGTGGSPGQDPFSALSDVLDQLSTTEATNSQNLVDAIGQQTDTLSNLLGQRHDQPAPDGGNASGVSRGSTPAPAGVPGNTHAHVQRGGIWGYLNKAGSFVAYAARPAGSGWSTRRPSGAYETFFTRSGTTYYKSTAKGATVAHRSAPAPVHAPAPKRSTKRVTLPVTVHHAPPHHSAPRRSSPPHRGGPMKAI